MALHNVTRESMQYGRGVVQPGPFNKSLVYSEPSRNKRYPVEDYFGRSDRYQGPSDRHDEHYNDHFETTERHQRPHDQHHEHYNEHEEPGLQHRDQELMMTSRSIDHNARKHNPNDYYDIKLPQSRRNFDIQADQKTDLEFSGRGTVAQRTYDAMYGRPRNKRTVGGLGFIRFRDIGYDRMKLQIAKLQSIICSSQGLSMGIAKADKIFVMEGKGDWAMTNFVNSDNYSITENAIVVFWFASEENFKMLMANSKNSDLKEYDFPTQHGYDSFYLPLNSPLDFSKAYRTFLLLELSDANRYRLEDLSQFEGEVRKEISNIPYIRSQPFIVSEMRGPTYHKPGPFIGRGNVKVYVSMFEKQEDVNHIWKAGIIQRMLKKYDLIGGIHVASFSALD